MIPLFAANALPFLRTYWKEIAVGGVVLALALGFYLRGNTIDSLRDKLATEKALHEITRASVETLETEIATQNAAVATLARTAADKQKASQDALRAAEKRNEALAGKIAGLERSASVRRSDGLVCEVSDAVAEVWK